MAILKAIKEHSTSKGGSKGVLKYVGEKALKTDGLNCSNDYKEALKDFQETKTMYNKHEGRQYKHYAISFKEGEIGYKGAMEITREYVEKTFPDHEVFIGLHNDKGHVHTHLVVNSVSIDTGKKLHESANDLQEKKEALNEICLKRGLEIPQKSTQQGKVLVWDKKKYKVLEKAGSDYFLNKKPEADNLKLVNEIELTLTKVTSKDEFVEQMNEKGYEVAWKENNKNITFTIPEDLENPKKKRKFRLKTLGKDFNIAHFSKEGLEERFQQNRELERLEVKELGVQELKKKRQGLKQEYTAMSKLRIFKRKEQEEKILELEKELKGAIEEKDKIKKNITEVPSVQNNLNSEMYRLGKKQVKIIFPKSRSKEREKDRGFER